MVGGIASLPGAIIGGIFVQVIEKYADALARQARPRRLHLPIEIEPWTIYGIALIIARVHSCRLGIAGGVAAPVAWAARKRS